MIDSAQYAALTRGAGIVDFRGRTLIEMSGVDAASFLQGFCTNDVKRLTPGQGCEAFITSVQGKILGHVAVCREAERIVLGTVPGEAEKLIAHLDRYIIRQQVTLADRSQEWGELLLGGAASPGLLADRLGIAPPAAVWGSIEASLEGRAIEVQRADPLLGAPGFLVRAEVSDLDVAADALATAGATRCDSATFDTIRIEAGWPIYGPDISEQNLPQEVDRDAAAISFTKGCYLGQETVARIDALGHVNRKLRGLKFAAGETPKVGTVLMAGEKEAGFVTSACFSPKLGGPLALGYVRRGHEAFGTKLTTAQGEAEVVKLPL